MRKQIVIVLLAVFLLVFGAFISATILSLYAVQLGGTLFQIGILSSSMYVVRLFFGVPIGRLADKKGPITILKYSLMLFPFIAVGYLLSYNISTLIGARLLHGCASAMLLPMAMAYIGEVSPKGEEGKYMGIYNTIILLATGLGPLVSTIIADVFNSYRATFFVLLFFSLLALILILLTPKSKTERNINAKIVNSKLSIPFLFKPKRLLALAAVNISLAVISSLVGFFVIIFLKTRGISLIYSGIILAIYNITYGIFQIPFGRLMDRSNKYVMVLSSGALTGIALLLFPISHNIWIMAAILLLTAVVMAAFLSSTSALSIVVGREIGMGSTMGFLSTANSIGMIFGGISLSLVPKIMANTNNSFDAFFYLASGITLVSTILFSILWKESVDSSNLIKQ